jgi:hypothetical protein
MLRLDIQRADKAGAMHGWFWIGRTCLRKRHFFGGERCTHPAPREFIDMPACRRAVGGLPQLQVLAIHPEAALCWCEGKEGRVLRLLGACLKRHTSALFTFKREYLLDGQVRDLNIVFRGRSDGATGQRKSQKRSDYQSYEPHDESPHIKAKWRCT